MKHLCVACGILILLLFGVIVLENNKRFDEEDKITKENKTFTLPTKEEQKQICDQLRYGDVPYADLPEMCH